MANYTDSMYFGMLFRIFTRYVHISHEIINKYCNIENERLNLLYQLEDISLLTCEELSGLTKLMSYYMNIEIYNKNVADDEEEYCWVIGKKLIHMLNDEQFRRANLTKGVQRKREE